MALTPDEELELIDIELEQLRLQKAKAAQQTAPPDVSSLYAEEQEALDNAPYLSPEMRAATDASLAALRSKPADAPNQSPGGPSTQAPIDWKPLMRQHAPPSTYERVVDAIKPGIEHLQQNYGRPFAEGVLDFGDWLEGESPVGDQQPVRGTRTEAIIRNVLAPIAGEDFQKETSPAAKADFEKLVGRIPGVGADTGGYGLEPLSPSPETAANLAGGFMQAAVPMALAGNMSEGVTKMVAPKVAASGAGWIAANAPTLSKLIGYGAEGFTGGAIEGLLIKSQDPLKSGLMGAGGDVALRGFGGELGSAALRKGKSLIKGKAPTEVPPQVVGIITPEAKKQVLDESFAALGAEPKTIVDEAGVDMALRAKNMPEGRAPDAPSPSEVAAAEVTPPTVKASDIEKPFAARVRLGEDGQPVLSILEVKRGQMPRAADMPLGTHQERSKAFSYMWKKGLEMADIGEDALSSPRTQQFFDELRMYKEERAIAAGPIDRKPIKELDDFFAAKHPGKASGEFLYDPKANRIVEKGPLPPDPDALPGPPKEGPEPQVIKQHEDGTLTVSRDDVPTNPGGTPTQLTGEGEVNISGGRLTRGVPPSNSTSTPSRGPARAAAEPPPPAPPNGGGPPPPPPKPPPPGPGDLPPAQVESMAIMKRAMDQMGAQPGLWEKSMRQLVGAHARGPKDAGELILMQRGQAVLEETAKDVFDALQAKVPKKDRFAFEKDFARYAAGDKLGADALKTKYPKAWAQVEELGNKLLQERDFYDPELRRLGFLSDDVAPLIENGTFDKYLARSYLSYVLPPGEWAKHVRKNRPDLIENAAKALKAKFPKWTDYGLAVELTRILNAQDPFDAYAGSTLSKKGRAQNALLERKDIPKEIRALLGEVESGTLKLAISLGNQRALYANALLWNEIVANPTMFSPTWTEGMHPKALPDSKRHFGPAAGGFVTPHLYDALVNLPKAIETGPQWLRALMGFSKGNEVAMGGMTPWVNAILGNQIYSLYAGGIDFTNPGHMGKYLLKAMRELYRYKRNPIGDSWVLSAKKYGTDASGVGGTEFGGGDNPIEELAGQWLTRTDGPPPSGPDIVAHWGKSIGRRLKSGYKTVGASYDLIDRTYKLANFMAIVDREVAKGVDVHTAMKHASYRVNQSFTAPDKMGPLPTKLSRGIPGFFAKYGTFFMEDLRIQGSLPKRLLEEPDLRARLLKAAIVMGGLYGYNGLNRYWSGITQDEIDKMEAATSDGAKYHRPLTYTLGWRNSQGKPHVIDLSSLLPLGRLLAGHPDDAMFQRILANLVTGTFDSGVAENEVSNWLARTGLIRPVRGPQDMLPGEDPLLRTIQGAWDLGLLGPKAPERVYEALRKTEAFGPVGPTTEQYTPGEAAAKIAGLPVVPSPTPTASGPSATGATFEFMRETKELEKALIRVAAQPPEQALPFIKQLYRAVAFSNNEAYKAAALKRIEEEYKKTVQRMEERQRILGGKK